MRFTCLILAASLGASPPACAEFAVVSPQPAPPATRPRPPQRAHTQSLAAHTRIPASPSSSALATRCP